MLVDTVQGQRLLEEKSKTEYPRTMSYPSDQEVTALMRDFEKDFGMQVPVEDARRMLVLYDELCELFERYGGDIATLPSAL